MKDNKKELKKLGDAIATSLGNMVFAVGVFTVISVIMHAIYYKPPEEGRDRPSHDAVRHGAITTQLLTNSTFKWHPLNVYHR